MGLQDPIGVRTALERRREKSTIRQLSTNPASSVDFSSNDFLSLATSPELRRRFLRGLANCSKERLETGPLTTHLGSGGSRLLDGNSSYAEALETEIAAFHNAPCGLLCNSGFDANVSIFSCLPQPGDIIAFDELIHASVHDGMRLSRAGKRISFPHNDLNRLEEILRQCLADDADLQAGRKNVFIAVEAVYSMDGDVAPLAEIVAMLSALLPLGVGHLIVDEAHSTGIFGSQGRGLVCELGLEDKVTVRLHTFGKAMACGGAILLCSPTLRHYFLNFARPLIYTTFMPYPSLAAIHASYSLLQDGHAEPLVAHLQMLIAYLQDSLIQLVASLRLPPEMRHLLRVPRTRSTSAISYVMSSQPKTLAAYCRSKGYVVRAIVPPTVPAGTERLRICLHAGNTVEQIDGFLRAIHSWIDEQRREAEPEYVKARM
ncbi:pyridoxal phosphate-dependent transferase [Neohortaea acidophila]|uniref:Pyridoxal phosphate-dependent transferase n=1 Tax=Neohortaea acidophila TaxID=245834 RepID=A0A6A6PUY7_9PEZI|nr:pyridoxal phosphate-dependent transferase [Neohortaea acidophila]KAF2483938.1 pyridoxal phosphate-dependent transferase [Neohortaea acidophila]